MKKLLLTLILALSISTPALSADTIKIGLANVFSGPLAIFGEVTAQGAQLAVDQINKEGGLLGRNLEIIRADTQGEPEKAQGIVMSLVQDQKVDVIIGMTTGAEANAVAPEMTKLKTPLIVTNAMDGEVTGRLCSPWVFRVMGNTDQFCRAAALVAGQRMTATRWTTVGPDYGFGKDAWTRFADHLGKLRFSDSQGKVKAHKFESAHFAPITTTDWKPLIESLQKSPSDGILLTLFGGNLTEFIRQAKTAGWFQNKEVICLIGGGIEVFFPLGYLDLPEGVWFGAPYWPDAYYEDPLNTQFVNDYMAKSAAKIPPSFAAYMSYIAVMFYKSAVEEVGSVDKVTVANSLSGLALDLPAGATMFRTEDHQAMCDLVFGKTTNKPSKYLKRIRALDPIVRVRASEVTASVAETGCKMRKAE